MRSILIFAGTSEGRRIAEYLSEQRIPAHVCAATEYGGGLLPENDSITVSSVRLGEAQMEKMLQGQKYTLVIDATHPYAIEVSKNIKKACEHTGMPYVRMLRETENYQEENVPAEGADGVYVDSVRKAAAFLSDTKGNVLVTTGSKEMDAYLTIPNAGERLYYRVLSTTEAVTRCKELQIEGRHLFAMQGPFSEAMNYAMLLEIQAAYLVTKDSGKAGGFQEKIAAAKRAGVTPVIIRRPVEKNGYSYEEVINLIAEYADREEQGRHIQLIGIGPGDNELMTIQAKRCIENADLLLGASRMVEAVSHLTSPSVTKVTEYQPSAILSYIKEHPFFKNIVVLYSGDVGFYSGAKQLEQGLAGLPEYQYERINGISSPVYFLSRLGKPWDNVRMISMHGKTENVIAYVQRNQNVVVLLGGTDSVSNLAEQFLVNQLSHVRMTIGENLSYPEELIRSGKPEEWIGKNCDSLAIALIENDTAKSYIVTHGMPDAQFIREKVPMTKMEIRSISLSKLQLTKDAVIYDIGAGTGSIAIEAARHAPEGMVYAIEKEQDARELIQENQHQFGVTNVTVIAGKAPACFAELPMPTHAFIGGSGGEMEQILTLLLHKNPKIRIVINVIALDTLSCVLEAAKTLQIPNVEYVQVSIAKSRETGGYRMMMAQNPVYIITLQNKERHRS